MLLQTVLMLAWAAFLGVFVTLWMDYRRKHPKVTQCSCEKYILDDKDPLVTTTTVHEVSRCYPRSEIVG